MDIKYPEASVKLSDEDGNAFAILGAVGKALREHGVSQSEINDFVADATSGDYDHLLRVCMCWVNVR